ncbi:MAG: asparaginase [Thermaerobacterales bacterium]
MAKPIVHVLTTGGTIAGRAQPGGEVAPGLTADELLAPIPEARASADVIVTDVFNLPSASMGWPELLTLARTARDIFKNPNVAGIVITHGTGRMEQAAYFVDLLHDDERPVVFTGAMRNPTLPSADGAFNLLSAIRTAADPKSRGLGVLVVMIGLIHAAASVNKLQGGRLDAFQSPEFGPLGALDEDYVFYGRRPYHRIPALPLPEQITARVQRIPPGIDQAEGILDAVIGAGVDGLIFESGRFMPERLARVEAALDRGIAVVLCNPYLTGRLPRNTYRHQGGESHLLEIGVIFSGTNALKAQAKLTLALSAGLPPAAVRESFHQEWYLD